MSKLAIAALTLTLAAVGGGASKCTVGKGSTPNESQGTVTQIEHHPANDETVLYLRLNNGTTDTDTMVTSAHDWDHCGIGATWPACLKSHGG
jgi:hypothetical protein